MMVSYRVHVLINKEFFVSQHFYKGLQRNDSIVIAHPTHSYINFPHVHKHENTLKLWRHFSMNP